MSNPTAGKTAQSGSAKDTTVSNLIYNDVVLSNKIFNKNMSAGLIARDILLGNKNKNIQQSPKPNLKNSRNRSSSESSQNSRDGATDMITDEFIAPRKPAKVRKTLKHTNASTSNQFMVLSDSEISDTETNINFKNTNNKKNKLSNNGKSKPNIENPESMNNKTTSKINKVKPPPIYVQLPGIKSTITFLSSGGISTTDFIVREFDNTFTKIFPNNMETFDLMIALLKSTTTKYFTYTPRHLKVKTVVLKGVRGGYDEKDVKSALDSLHLPDVTITKVSKLNFDRNNPHLFHFLVSATASSMLAPFTRQKTLLSQPIKWERLRKPTIFMCKRCQQTGHSSANCQLPPVCVKCAGDHESKDCSITSPMDKSSLKCINCGETGHPANYRGCPALKLITKVKLNNKKINEAKKKKLVNAINNYVTPGYSFANVMNPNGARHFPPLPRAKSRSAGLPFDHNFIDSPQEPTSGSASNPNISRMEELLISFKNDITSEFRKINDRISANASRIDQIMAAFFTEDE